MIDVTRFSLTLLGTIGCGVMAGVYLIFSIAIMPALNRLAPAEGIRAMQKINVVIVNPLFMLVFLGTAIVSIALVVMTIVRRNGDNGSTANHVYLIAGAVLYVVGSIVVTVAFNIPRNDSLDALDPTAVGAAEAWSSYVREWTAWNHVRTLLTLASTASFILALSAD
jgi:uncharacterized membrane protein